MTTASTPKPASVTSPGKSASKAAKTPIAKGAKGKKPKMLFAAPTGGRSLDHGTRKSMERGYRQSFSDVRIFTDKRAGDLAEGLGAKAVTIGKDVYFAPGRYSPTTTEGKRTIAHELAHVAHNRHSGDNRTGVAPVNARSEAKANAAADTVLAGNVLAGSGFRDWGPTWQAQCERIVSRGTSQHTGDVAGPIPYDPSQPIGTVDVRTGEEVELPSGTRLPNVISIEYSGDMSAEHQWLQFVWFELTVTSPTGVTRQSGSIATTSGTLPFTTDPSAPNWAVDSGPTDPFYESGAINLRDSSSTTIFDAPGGASIGPFAARALASVTGSTRATFTAHFATYLVQRDHAVYVVRYSASTVVTRSGSTATVGGIGYTVGTSGPTSGLPTDLRDLLHAQYISHTHIT
ncbi:DUF4157 domain-containing protein [Ruegeria sp. 2205SS24-7]|uniref:eCIS core domain-containing protein n=1 Tax=Ruegeria discodermiae TaxID=3064389 RepID=UPI0027404EA4|nr:DUF4157 domain-containing protein [Ruegeria sp. 2205SS24-7]MDP5220838.1 DUF4157 domain-containing protein [Ruegeria sp. 2205SS24-7]